jgi:hypothetical protein
VFFEYNQNYLKHHEPLSVLPNDSRTLQTLLRSLYGKWSSVGSGDPWWPLCILRSSFSHWTVNIDVPFPLFNWYKHSPRSDRWYHHTSFNLVTDYRYWTHTVIFHSHDLVTCCAASDVISPNGPRLSSLSCGWTNSALGSYASIYSVENHESTFFSHPVKEETINAMKAYVEVVIKYNLTV